MKQANADWYAHAFQYSVHGSNYPHRENYLDLDPDYRDAYGGNDTASCAREEAESAFAPPGQSLACGGIRTRCGSSIEAISLCAFFWP